MCFHFLSFSSLFLSSSLYFSLLLSFSRSQTEKKTAHSLQMRPSCPESRPQSCRRAFWHQPQSSEGRWRVSLRNACVIRKRKSGCWFWKHQFGLHSSPSGSHAVLDHLGPNALKSQCRSPRFPNRRWRSWINSGSLSTFTTLPLEAQGGVNES